LPPEFIQVLDEVKVEDIGNPPKVVANKIIRLFFGYPVTYLFSSLSIFFRVEFNDYESNNRIYLAMAKLYKIKKDQIHRFILKRRVSLWAASNLCQILPPTLR
jgi:hypothetical protein